MRSLVWFWNWNRSRRRWIWVVVWLRLGRSCACCLLLLDLHLACRGVGPLQPIVHRLRMGMVECTLMKSVWNRNSSHVLADADHLPLCWQRNLAHIVLTSLDCVVGQHKEWISNAWPTDWIAAGYRVCVFEQNLILLVLVFQLCLSSLVKWFFLHTER